MPPSSEFARVLEHLHDDSRPFPPGDLYLFSSLAAEDLRALEAAWPETPAERRRGVMQDLAELADASFELMFDSVFRLGLDDEDAEVRATCVTALWDSEELDLAGVFMRLLKSDPATGVRAAAASGLGRYVYLSEFEEISRAAGQRAEEALLAVINGQDEPEVRRRALEALAFSSRAEVPGLIEAAYASSEPRFRVSAVFAMGRSADSRWAPQVLAELAAASPEIRFEAVRAAGELELSQAVEAVGEHLDDPDLQIREAAVWSLGQIGGDQARELLIDRLELADEDEREFIEEALENLALNDKLDALDFLNFGEPELDLLDNEEEEGDEDDLPA